MRKRETVDSGLVRAAVLAQPEHKLPRRGKSGVALFSQTYKSHRQGHYCCQTVLAPPVLTRNGFIDAVSCLL